jgi:hypothetical protein
MDMAEKDATEGRCLARRSAYDKEKIVAMAATCDTLILESLILPFGHFQVQKMSNLRKRRSLS